MILIKFKLIVNLKKEKEKPIKHGYGEKVEIYVGETLILGNEGEKKLVLSACDEFTYLVGKEVETEKRDPNNGAKKSLNIEKDILGKWVSTGLVYDNPRAVAIAPGYPATWAGAEGEMHYNFTNDNNLSYVEPKYNGTVFWTAVDNETVVSFIGDVEIDGKTQQTASIFYIVDGYLYEVSGIDGKEY